MSHPPLIYDAQALGLAIKAERRAVGKTQAQVAAVVGCRRQTVADLEAGRNVTVGTLLSTLGAIGKRLQLVDSRPELDQLASLLDDPDED